MQAIILAAGMGKRLGNFTKDNTKCMVKLNGTPLISRMLKQLESLNLKRIVLVVGYQAENLKTFVGDKVGDTPVEYVTNPIFDKTNNIYSLALAEEFLREDDTLLLESDLVFEDSVLDKIINDPRPNLALVSKYETWMDGTMVRIDADNNIVSFIPKSAFEYSEIGTYYKTVNIYKFSKEFSENYYVPFLKAYMSALGNNEYYEQVLRVITAFEKTKLKALPLGGEKWYEIDDAQDLDIAETIFAEDEQKLGKYFKRYGGYWRFNGLLDYCYLVNPYFPTRRMRDELKANFDVLLSEYPSGMGVNSLLMGKYFGVNKDYVCPGNGAAELIKSVTSMLAGRIGMMSPTFEEYPNRCSPQNVETFVPANPDFAYTAQDVKKFYDGKDVSTILIVNPDNPSGNFIPRADLIDLAEWTAQRKMRLIVDESFVDFADDENNSLISDDILEAHKNLIVIKSISKSYGVPGLRLGVAVSANTDFIGRLKNDVAIWNINSFAEFYLQIYGKHEKDYYKACDTFKAERKIFKQELDSVNFLRTIDSQANYFLCEVKGKYTSAELTKILLTRFNILIKDCGSKKSFDGRSYIRLAIRNRTDNKQLIDALNTL